MQLHSVKSYPDVTNGLLEFLFQAVDQFWPAKRPLLQRGLSQAMEKLLSVKVPSFRINPDIKVVSDRRIPVLTSRTPYMLQYILG